MVPTDSLPTPDPPRFTRGRPTSAADTARERRRRSARRVALALVAAAGLVAVAAVAAARRRGRDRARLAADLLADSRLPPDRSGFDPAAVSELPAPVRRYFEAVLSPGRRPIRAARVEWTGQFRLGDVDSRWLPFWATQHYTTHPPGFVWDATVHVLPMVPVRVIDAYRRRGGFLRATLLSAVTVAEAEPSPETTEAELLRYLAEAVWYPTALLPSAGVGWEAVDDHAARATLRDGDVAVSAVFRFDPGTGLVTEVAADRYRAATDDYAAWTGRFRDYEARDGVRVPTRATVAWSLPEGDLPYWRGTVDRLDYLDDDALRP